MEKMRGLLVIYLNRSEWENNQQQEDLVNLMVKLHADITKKINAEGYEVMFVPTQGEATRTEKIDFGKPFPRFVSNNKVIKDEDEEKDDDD